jgi:hypothetical protein|mmetsp:Transcript_24441/g.40971  ORF Transcript_24441/g.40971 Transcript_24441/m.40971 type:complete len:87 (-) Transcript_24441:1021-1281(-)
MICFPCPSQQRDLSQHGTPAVLLGHITLWSIALSKLGIPVVQHFGECCPCLGMGRYLCFEGWVGMYAWVLAAFAASGTGFRQLLPR